MSLTPEKLALKRATGEMIAGVGGLEAAAGFCRIGKSKLSENQNRNCEDSFVSLDVIADLEQLSRARPGWPHVTRALCTMMGGTFVPLAEPVTLREDLLGSVARLAKEHGEIAQAILAGLADDGKLDRAEARAAIEQVREGQAVLASLNSQLIAIVGEAD